VKKFIVDAQLPPALARDLTKRGFSAQHVLEMGLLGATDLAIWKRAIRERAAILTKDEDFAILRRTSSTGPAVVWLRIGNTANDSLSRWLLALMPQIISAIEAGDVLLELR